MVTTQEFIFPSSDGVHLVGATWWRDESERPRAVVQLVHGISEYIGRYATWVMAVRRRPPRNTAGLPTRMAGSMY